MTTGIGRRDAPLDEVLDAYAIAEPGPSFATLSTWIRDYPQFARELTEFTAAWQLLEWTDDPVDTNSDVTTDEVERLIRHGMRAARAAYKRTRRQRVRERRRGP